MHRVAFRPKLNWSLRAKVVLYQCNSLDFCYVREFVQPPELKKVSQFIVRVRWRTAPLTLANLLLLACNGYPQ
ncbi:unnamed protein product [Urochloa humidicola]